MNASKTDGHALDLSESADSDVVCSDRMLRFIRKLHPPLAQRIRATSGGHNGYG